MDPSAWGDCLCRNVNLSLGATKGSVTISLFSETREIAGVVSLLRNDITAQPHTREGRDEEKQPQPARFDYFVFRAIADGVGSALEHMMAWPGFFPGAVICKPFSSGRSEQT
jgi:hypothetical protein